jgi:hypothetical protein
MADVVARALSLPRRSAVERRLAVVVVAVGFVATAVHAPSAIRGVDDETSYYAGLTASERGYLEPRAIDLDTRIYEAAKQLLPRNATYYVDVGPKAPALAGSGAPAFAPYVLLPRRRVLDPSQAEWVLSYAGDLGALHLSYARVVDLGNGLQIAEVKR